MPDSIKKQKICTRRFGGPSVDGNFEMLWGEVAADRK